MNHHPAPDTQFISTFDLRVVAGLHAGARIAIGETANDALTVGHGPDCDVVLQDPALAKGQLTIRLARTEAGIVHGWQAASSAMPDEPGDIVTLGEVVSWGGLSLTVADQNTPWPSIDILHEATIAGEAALASANLARDAADTALQADMSSGDRNRSKNDNRNAERGNNADDQRDDNHRFASEDDNGSPAPNGAATHPLDPGAEDSANTVVLAETSDATDMPPADDTADGTHPEKSKSLTPRLRAWWSLIPAAVIVALISVVVVFLLGMLLIHILNGKGASSPPVKVMPATANQSAAQVTKVIERLGLASVLQVKTTSDGMVTVVGWVKDDTQRDQVAAALAQLTPMPAMTVGLESEAVNTAQQIVKLYGPYIDVVNDGGGNIRLIGLIESSAARAQLETDFRSQLPTAVLLDDRLLDREQMLAMLGSRLIDAGMPELSVVWTHAGMLIDARKNTRIDGDKVYAVVQAFKQQYGVRLPIFAHLNGEREALAPRALPFNISSITGGPLPSVVVDDGLSASDKQTRLLPGAVYRGYKLLGVTPKQVIFDGPQRVVVTR